MSRCNSRLHKRIFLSVLLILSAISGTGANSPSLDSVAPLADVLSASPCAEHRTPRTISLSPHELQRDIVALYCVITRYMY